MPIYTYQCYGCSRIQEVMRPIAKRDEIVACRYCMVASERIMDLSAFQLKGGGWAKDGYVKKPKEEKKQDNEKDDKSK